MKKFTLTILILLLFVKLISAQGKFVNIPDYYFMQALTEAGIDKNSDGKIDTAEASAVKKVNVFSKYINDLTGIEYFRNIDTLVCSANTIKTLNLTKNPKLIYLECNDNKLTDLNISNNSKLLNINCSKNLLTKLDISKCINITALNCHTNLITYLNITKNTKIFNLVLSNNTSLVDVCVWELPFPPFGVNVYTDNCPSLVYKKCGIGIEENQNINISVSPNPAHDYINIDINSNVSEISIFDISGRIVESVNVNNDQAIVNIKELKNGLYFIRIKTNDNKIINTKFIKS